MDKPSTGMRCGVASLGDWCFTFRDSVMASSSVAEKFNAESSLAFSILDYETIAPSRNVRYQSAVTRRHIPSRKDGDFNCVTAKARNPQIGIANRCTCAVFRCKHAIKPRKRLWLALPVHKSISHIRPLFKYISTGTTTGLLWLLGFRHVHISWY